MEDRTKQLTRTSSDFVFQHLNQHRVIYLYDGIIFGRTKGNELFQNDQLISSSHCKIHLMGKEVFIEDLGSTNKTRVNGKTIPPKTKIVLFPGDRIEIGNQQFVLENGSHLDQNKSLENTLSDQPGSSVSFTHPVKSLINNLEWKNLPTEYLGLGLALLYPYVFNDSPDNCFGEPLFPSMSWLTTSLICLVISLAFGLKAYKQKSWQIRILSSGKVWICLTLLAPLFNSSSTLEINTIKFACSCTGKPSTRTLLKCSYWRTGKYSWDDTLIPFKELPPQAQNKISSKLDIKLAQIFEQNPSGFERKSNTNLMYGTVAPKQSNASIEYLGNFQSFEGCEQLCALLKNCNAYIWHDSTTGKYAYQCYVRSDAFTSVPENGHFSGIKTNHTKMNTPLANQSLKVHSFCENDWATRPLSCPSGQKLEVKRLQYHRPQIEPCRHNSPTANQICSGKDYTAHAQKLILNGTLTWSAPPNQVFGEDPCPNIYKQIDIEYECKN